jgi:hypothetical protein
MGDRFSTTLEIGGKLERSKLHELVEALRSDTYGLDWGDPGAETEFREYIEHASENTGILSFHCSELSLSSTATTDFCEENRLSYVTYQEGKHEYDGDISWWRPGMKIPRIHMADHAGSRPVLGLSELKNYKTRGLTLAGVIKNLRAVPPKLPVFKLIQ